MPKSRKIGGQKAHNKRIQERKELMAHARKKMQEQYSKLLDQRLSELKNEYSQETTEIVELSENETQQMLENNQIVIPTNE